MSGSRIIGIVSAKGGTGKTTIALHLAGTLARRGMRIVVVDSDPAGHAAAVAGGGGLGASVWAHPLDSSDPDAVREWASGVRGLAADVVIIDAEGARGPSLAATIAVAELVLVPAGASILDLRGAAETVGIIRRHRDAAGRGRPKILIVPSRVDRRTLAGRELVGALTQLGEPVADPISARSAVVDSLAAGETVSSESPSGQEFLGLSENIFIALGLSK